MEPHHLSPEDILQAARAAGITQKAIAERLGIRQSAVSNLYKGLRELKYGEGSAILAMLGQSAGTREIPVIGMAGAGNWIEAVELSKTTINLPRQMEVQGSFAVEVVGDSMNLVLPEGAYAVVDPEQTELFSGRLYLLRNAEGEATIKQYKTDPSRFCPSSTDASYVPFLVGSTDFRVIGRITGALQKF